MKTSIILAALLAASSAFAQTTIDQAKALAGNVTPGDTAGFPITISLPGSYKLTSNLTVPAGVDGIVLTTDDVTLDLNGFTIAGPGTCTNTGSGTFCNTSYPSVAGVRSQVSNNANEMVVRNGKVKGFGYGVLMENGRVDHLAVTFNKIGLVSNGYIEASHVNARMNETGALVAGLVQNSVFVKNTDGFVGAFVSTSVLLNSMAIANQRGVVSARVQSVSATNNTANFVSTQNF